MSVTILETREGGQFWNPEFLEWLVDQLDFCGVRNLASIASDALDYGWSTQTEDVAAALVWLCDLGEVDQFYGSFFARASDQDYQEPTDSELLAIEAQELDDLAVYVLPTIGDRVRNLWRSFVTPRFSKFAVLLFSMFMLHVITWAMIASVSGRVQQVENFSIQGEPLYRAPVEQLDKFEFENNNPFDFGEQYPI